MRATLRGIQYAKNNEHESIRSIMKWTDMDQGVGRRKLRDGVVELVRYGRRQCSGLQIAMEEIRAELKLEAAPDASRAFDWSFVRRVMILRNILCQHQDAGSFIFCSSSLTDDLAMTRSN